MSHHPTDDRDPHQQLRSHHDASEWVVAKFGGTSLGKFMVNIAEQIVPAALEHNQKFALVCSARSGSTKATGTTNLLLRAASEALQSASAHKDPVHSLVASGVANDRFCSPPRTPNAGQPPVSTSTSTTHSHSQQQHKPARTASSAVLNGFYSGPPTRSSSPAPGNSSSLAMTSSISSLRSDTSAAANAAPPAPFHATVDQIKEDHIAAARQYVRDPDLLAKLEDELEYDCERLRSFLLAAQIIEEISLRSKDIIMGVGERLSCRIVAAVLQDRGVDSELVSFENIVERLDPESYEPEKLDQAWYDRLAKRMGERLQECGDRVPVVTGFFGIVPGSLLTQIGRGYTDLCAALCAVGVDAVELQIWKEVDGIFTADPRKVPAARLLPIITPEEAAELTYYGSEVIHPFTMDQVINATIPIRIKNVENPKGDGTVIFPEGCNPRHSSPSTVDEIFRANGYLGKEKVRNQPTAVTTKDQILLLNVRSNKKTLSHGFFAQIFGILDRHGIIVDLISTSEVQLSLSMHGIFQKGLLDRVVKDLSVVGEVSMTRDMTILSLVGKLKNMVGIAGKMFTVLANGGINIEVISQGASEVNISCVIDSRDAVKALNLVHLHLLSEPNAVSIPGFHHHQDEQ